MPVSAGGYHQHRMILCLTTHTQKRNVEPVRHSFHCVRLLALPDKSKRATLKAPRKCIYNYPTRYNPSIEMDTASWKECIQYTQGAFPLLCSWLIVELCENSTQSKPKRTVTPFMYMCLPKHPTHEGFQQGFDDAKIAKVLVSANFLTIFLCFSNKKAYLCTHHT